MNNRQQSSNSESNIFILLKNPSIPNRSELVNDAIGIYSEKYEKNLIELIRSENPIVKSGGYFIFSNMGKFSSQIVDEAILNISTGLDKFEVIDAMFSYPNRLNSNQLGFVRQMLHEEDDMTRDKAQKLLYLISKQSGTS